MKIKIPDRVKVELQATYEDNKTFTIVYFSIIDDEIQDLWIRQGYRIVLTSKGEWRVMSKDYFFECDAPDCDWKPSPMLNDAMSHIIQTGHEVYVR